MSLDPTIGRWISEDPIGFQAADANLYRYAGNDPTNRTDPSGLAAPFVRLDPKKYLTPVSAKWKEDELLGLLRQIYQSKRRLEPSEVPLFVDLARKGLSDVQNAADGVLTRNKNYLSVIDYLKQPIPEPLPWADVLPLLKDLNDDEFSVREAAKKALMKLGPSVAGNIHVLRDNVAALGQSLLAIGGTPFVIPLVEPFVYTPAMRLGSETVIASFPRTSLSDDQRMVLDWVQSRWHSLNPEREILTQVAAGSPLAGVTIEAQERLAALPKR